MVDEEKFQELAESFDKEARANEELAKEFYDDLELNTQYEAYGRAYRHAAWSLFNLLDPDNE